jgi:PAP2 superfamily
MFEAANAIVGRYQSYVGLRRASYDTSFVAAVAQAAHDTLASLYPSQRATFDAALAADLARLRSRTWRLHGIDLGRRAASAMLALRAHDGSDHPEALYGVDWIPSDAPGVWRKDPISQAGVALGAEWGTVRPFVLRSAAAFRVPPPPALTSAAYATAFDEVKAYGGDSTTTATLRSADQTEIGIYWAYDGTPSLCAPPRLYNQIAVTIAGQMGTGTFGVARLLALVNVAMADAGIAIWESKFHYQLWRPVTGIRESDPGTGPSGLGDGNPDTLGDPTFSPLGAPASNLFSVNFTPPFPAYPSGHAGFGGALFQTLRNFYGRDDIAFTFTSDELNGVTLDNQGNVRPLRPRSFASLSQAEEENGQSRIYLGIHWSFDKSEGMAQGRRVANEVYAKLFRRRR